jgi:type VI secretion system protein ImpK
MTDIDDPFKPSDATVMRPRPGAGRRGAADVPPPRPAVAASHAEPLPAAALPTTTTGLNPLVQAASALLMLAGHLRGTLAAPDVAGVKRQIVDEIRRFEDRARAAGISREVVTSARYVLCACLDEAVLSTPWGAQSEWAQQTLLVAMHRETWGGEKFFDMLDGISQDPERHIDLMELQYMCLALGFSGKYQVSSQGHARLAEVRQDLYRRISTFHGPSNPALSLKWKGVEDRRNPVIRYVPWWVGGARRGGSGKLLAAAAGSAVRGTDAPSAAGRGRGAAGAECRGGRRADAHYPRGAEPVCIRKRGRELAV